MTMKQRYDSAPIKARFDDNGFLHDEPIIARIGIQSYMRADGTVQREFRPADEVFKAEAMERFRGMPIVEGHKEVTVKNSKGVVVGALSGAARRDGIGLLCPIVIHDADSIEAAKRGDSSELSVGYKTNDIHRPGWGNIETGEYIFKDDEAAMATLPAVMGDEWEEFDVLQTNIVPNHVAKVRKGRAGIARLNLDGSEEIKYDGLVDLNKDKEQKMTVKIKLDNSLEYDVPKEVAAHIAKLDGDIVTITAKADGLEAERDGLQAKVDSLPELVATAVAEAKVKTDAFNEAVSVAESFGVKVDGLKEVKDVKLAVIKHVSGKDVSDRSDAYIDGAYDSAKESDKMAANRIAISGKEKSDKSDEVDNGIPDPQLKFRK